MIYPMVKHSDWETNPKVKKILKLKLAVNEMERDLARLDRQIEEQQQAIEKLAEEKRHVRTEIRRVDALIADLEAGKTRSVQKEIDAFQDGTPSYRRQKKAGATKQTKRRIRK